MKKIKIRDMICSKKWISDMKSVVGEDRTIEIYISPGGVPKACSASLDADPVEAASEGDYNPQSCGSAGRRLR